MASGLISTEEFDRLRRDAGVTVLDVRGTAYLKGHIPGAVSTRWKDFLDPASPSKLLHPDGNVLAKRFGALGVADDRPVVLYSEPFENWGAEGRFFWMLHYLGHDDVRVLDGGYPKWKREGRATTLIPTRPQKAPFTPRVREEALIDREGVAKCVGMPPNEAAVLVDARGEDEVRKEGRVPGAVNLPWSSLYRADGTLRPEAELRALFETAGITPEREVIPYCTGGVRSALVFFALHLLGYPHIRNYDGSWWDWRLDPELPVQR